MIALTFDDGPHPVYVPRLLALLGKEKIRATFFLIGEQLKRYPSVARAIVEEGHEIGNHTLNHKDLRRVPESVAKSEIAGMQRLIEERLGLTPTLYRPPYGSLTKTVKRICAREHLAIIMWDVDTNDWRRAATTKTIVQTVLDNASSGSIILFHATRAKTVEAVARLIPLLRERGYEFVTVSQLLEDLEIRKALRRYAQKPASSAETKGKPTSRAGGPPPFSPPTTKPIRIPTLPLP